MKHGRLERGLLACLMAAGGLCLTGFAGASGAAGPMEPPGSAGPTLGVNTLSPGKKLGFGTKPVTDPRQDGLYTAQDSLAPLFSMYADSLGEMRWSMASETLTIETLDNERGVQVRREIVALHVPVKVEFVSVKHSKEALLAAALRLLETSKSWSGGLDGVCYAAADTALGSVVLGVHIDHLEEWREAVQHAPSSFPIVVRGEARIGVNFQSR